MTARSTDDLFWTTAREACTAKQLRVLELRVHYGLSLRTVALATGSSLSTVRGHLDAAYRRIDLALQEATLEQP